jgi:hypothetical protein
MIKQHIEMTAERIKRICGYTAKYFLCLFLPVQVIICYGFVYFGSLVTLYFTIT